MKRFNQWFTEVESTQPPPANGGINGLPAEVSQEILQMASHLNKLNKQMQEMLVKFGIQQGDDKAMGMQDAVPSNNANLSMNSGPQ